MMEWIKCSDRLPSLENKYHNKGSQWVLVIIDQIIPLIAIGRLRHEGWDVQSLGHNQSEEYAKGINDEEKVTHWMPLPEEPKESQ